MAELEVVEVTWMRVCKVWWSLLWRGVLFGFVAGAAVGFIIAFFMGMAKAQVETIKNVCTIAGYIVSIPIGIGVTKLVLKTRYSDFRIALVSNKA